MGSGVSRAPDDTRFVVVGGGYAGVELAMHLRKLGNVILINPEEFFFHNVGALRACVEPAFAKKIMIPLKEAFGDSFVQGKVVSINKTSNSVTLDNGKEIKYTHLFLATGSSGSFPAQIKQDYPKSTLQEGIQLYENINGEIKQAETIVCVGGGAVGVELSGELKTDYPAKKIILIHSNNTLCSSKMKANIQSKLHSAIGKKGIELVLGERVSNLADLEINKCIKDQVVKTESGKEIKADLIFRCIGGKPATDGFKDALGDAINDRGLIKVDEHLKVVGTENIYALGDITDIDEEKMAVAADVHANFLSKNLKALFAGKKLAAYKTSEFIMVVPIGRDGGVGQLPMGISAGDFVVKNVKGKDMFYAKYWDKVKLKPPA